MHQTTLPSPPNLCHPHRRRWLTLLALAAWLAGASAPLQAQMRIFVIAAGEPVFAGATLPPDALPDTHIGRGNNDIVQAWLAMPTQRLSRGVLGDKIEAAAVRVRTRAGAVLGYTLPENSVFEDLIPRVHDLDGDGRDEVILVRSQREKGSSLMALGIREGKLVPLAESQPLDRTGQWINPVGVADVDGDGRPELLVIVSPHDNGLLIEYKFDGTRFIAGDGVTGVSNHIAGSRDQGMSAIMDANGDGNPDVIIPSSDRLHLRVFTFDADVPLEFTRINLPARAEGNFEILPPHTLVVPLEDGRRVRIDWR